MQPYNYAQPTAGGPSSAGPMSSRGQSSSSPSSQQQPPLSPTAWQDYWQHYQAPFGVSSQAPETTLQQFLPFASTSSRSGQQQQLPPTPTQQTYLKNYYSAPPLVPSQGLQRPLHHAIPHCATALLLQALGQAPAGFPNNSGPPSPTQGMPPSSTMPSGTLSPSPFQLQQLQAQATLSQFAGMPPQSPSATYGMGRPRAKIKALLTYHGASSTSPAGLWEYSGGETRLLGGMDPLAGYAILAERVQTESSVKLGPEGVLRYELPGSPGTLVDVRYDEDVANMWSEWAEFCATSKQPTFKLHLYVDRLRSMPPTGRSSSYHSSRHSGGSNHGDSGTATDALLASSQPSQPSQSSSGNSLTIGSFPEGGPSDTLIVPSRIIPDVAGPQAPGVQQARVAQQARAGQQAQGQQPSPPPGADSPQGQSVQPSQERTKGLTQSVTSSLASFDHLLATVRHAIEIIRPADLRIMRFIGSGGFADCYLARWLGVEVAVKCLRDLPGAHTSSRAAVKELLREASVLAGMRHPNVLCLYALALPDAQQIEYNVGPVYRAALQGERTSLTGGVVDEGQAGGQLATVHEGQETACRDNTSPLTTTHFQPRLSTDSSVNPYHPPLSSPSLSPTRERFMQGDAPSDQPLFDNLAVTSMVPSDLGARLEGGRMAGHIVTEGMPVVPGRSRGAGARTAAPSSTSPTSPFASAPNLEPLVESFRAAPRHSSPISSAATDPRLKQLLATQQPLTAASSSPHSGLTFASLSTTVATSTATSTSTPLSLDMQPTAAEVGSLIKTGVTPEAGSSARGAGVARATGSVQAGHAAGGERVQTVKDSKSREALSNSDEFDEATSRKAVLAAEAAAAVSADAESQNAVSEGLIQRPALVAEFLSGCSMYAAIRRRADFINSDLVLIKVALDASRGMEYCHSKLITHWNLKVGNLIVGFSSDKVPLCKIADVGLSRPRQLAELDDAGVARCLPWSAPELVRDPQHATNKADVFSFGMCMWAMWARKFPYDKVDIARVFLRTMQGHVVRPPIPGTPEWESTFSGEPSPREPAAGWSSLMQRCWAQDPAQRPPFSEVSTTLSTIFHTAKTAKRAARVAAASALKVKAQAIAASADAAKSAQHLLSGAAG